MKYTLKAYSIWEQGPREKQEDSIFPKHGEIADTDRLFILCDGMGGHSAGEVASATVCSAMSTHILAHTTSPEGDFTDDDFMAALSAAYDALDEKDNGAAKKMGTTLTFLKLHNKGCTIAHIGDSRVYHIRPGKNAEDTEILFQTEDHSLVNDLVKIGELTREEAKQSKQKNVITRAIQPCMERRSKADIYHSWDIEPGDYFMLCSDGILEQMEDENLKFIFSAKGGDIANKIDILIKATAHNHDNHSAIIVSIKEVDSTDDLINSPAPELLMAQEVDSRDIPSDEARRSSVINADARRTHKNKTMSSGHRLMRSIICCLLTALVVFGVFFICNYLKEKTSVADDKPVKKEINGPSQIRRKPQPTNQGAIKQEKIEPSESSNIQDSTPLSVNTILPDSTTNDSQSSEPSSSSAVTNQAIKIPKINKNRDDEVVSSDEQIGLDASKKINNKK